MKRPDIPYAASVGLLARYRRRLLLVMAALAAVGLVAFLLASPSDISRRAGAEPGSYLTTHSAKFLCGTAVAGDPLVPAEYATAINVHNFTPTTITIQKKAVEAWDQLHPLPPGPWHEVILEPDYAFEIDCEDIYYLLGYPAGGPGYVIKGFVVIAYAGRDPLVDVVGVYTATDVAALGVGQTIDIERIPAKVQVVPPVPADPLAWYTYSAKFVCGTVTAEDGPVVPADYLTAVNVHNPSLDTMVSGYKKAVWALPESEPDPMPPSQWYPWSLEPDFAFEIDCDEIALWLFGGSPPEFYKGFVVIESPYELDVVGVYTAERIEPVGKGLALDIEQVPYTRQPQPVVPPP